MERQNVTLPLPKELLKSAKVIAAQEDKSLSALIWESLVEKLQCSSGYAGARRRQISLMREGIDLGTSGNAPCQRSDSQRSRLRKQANRGSHANDYVQGRG